MANTSTPWVAWENAAVVGQDLAVLPLLHKYDHIHFIAHSAGSRLIEKAAQTIRQTDSSSPTIHSTFLDAFAPSGHTSIYGESADWAEHYFDTRLIKDWIPLFGEDAVALSEYTDVILPHAFNIDVTNSDTFDKHSPHQWPHEWYNWSIEFWVYAFSVEVGFELSLERGLLSSLPSHAPGAGGELFYPRGGICVMSDLTSKLDDCGKVSQGSW